MIKNHTDEATKDNDGENHVLNFMFFFKDLVFHQ